jgi:hypothetical protein
MANTQCSMLNESFAPRTVVRPIRGPAKNLTLACNFLPIFPWYKDADSLRHLSEDGRCSRRGFPGCGSGPINSGCGDACGRTPVVIRHERLN